MTTKQILSRIYKAKDCTDSNDCIIALTMMKEHEQLFSNGIFGIAWSIRKNNLKNRLEVLKAKGK